MILSSAAEKIVNKIREEWGDDTHDTFMNTLETLCGMQELNADDSITMIENVKEDGDLFGYIVQCNGIDVGAVSMKDNGRCIAVCDLDYAEKMNTPEVEAIANLDKNYKRVIDGINVENAPAEEIKKDADEARENLSTYTVSKKDLQKANKKEQKKIKACLVEIGTIKRNPSLSPEEKEKMIKAVINKTKEEIDGICVNNKQLDTALCSMSNIYKENGAHDEVKSLNDLIQGLANRYYECAIETPGRIEVAKEAFETKKDVIVKTAAKGFDV